MPNQSLESSFSILQTLMRVPRSINFRMKNCISSPLLKREQWISHGMSKRNLGNVSRRFGTDTSYLKGRKRFFEAANVCPSFVAAPAQVHGGNVAIVHTKRMFEGASRVYAEMDGLITNIPGVALFITTADCLPIFLADPVTQSIGLLHAGWRSIVSGIGNNAVQLMQTHFGTSPPDLLIYIGPSIRQCCFGVRTDVQSQFDKYSNAVIQLDDIEGEARYSVDLISVVRAQFQEMGVLEKNLDSATTCTCCSPKDFYSHRRDGRFRTGSMGSTLMIKI